MCPRVAGLPSSPTLLTAFFYPGPGLSFIFCWWLEYNSTFPHSGGMLYSFRSPGRVNRCILWSARKYFPRPLLLRLLSRAQISDCKELSDSSLSQKFAKLSQPGAFIQVQEITRCRRSPGAVVTTRCICAGAVVITRCIALRSDHQQGRIKYRRVNMLRRSSKLLEVLNETAEIVPQLQKCNAKSCFFFFNFSIFFFFFF